MVGKFIVFEGIDGSGKSLMNKLIKKYLIKELNYSKNQVVLTFEPTNNKFGLKAREIQKKESNPLKSGEKCLELYIKDREQHLEKLIKPALSENKIVLCDRYKYSTFVYQSLQGIEEQKIIELHKKMLKPDLVLIFNVTPETALKRISSRGKLEKFEEKKFMEKVAKKFLKLKEKFPNENIKIINAEKNKKEVFEQVKKEIKTLL